MDSQLKWFIEKHAQLIDDNNWGEFYEKANYVFQAKQLIGTLTELLLEAGIHPLDNLSYIPSYYLAYSYRKEFNIPQGIKTIQHSAFYYSDFETMIIPDSVLDIDEWAFFLCSNLEEITYLGTIKQWRMIKKSPHYIGQLTTIHCKDGDIQA